MINDSVANYRRAIAILPDDVNAHLMAASAMPRIIASDGQIINFRNAIEAHLNSISDDRLRFDGGKPYAGSAAFFCAYHNRNDRYLNSLLALAHLSVFSGLAWHSPHCSATFEHERPTRIKLGIASNFLFANHTIFKLNLGWIERICRKKFEV